MDSSLTKSSTPLQKNDVFFNTNTKGAGSVRRVAQNDIRVSWFTGPNSSKSEYKKKAEVKKLLQTGEWKRIASGSDYMQRTQNFLQSFLKCVGFGITYIPGDSLPQLPHQEKYLLCGITHRWFDHQGTLSKRGARIATHCSKLAEGYGKKHVAEIINRDGVRTFIQYSKRLSNPCVFEYLADILQSQPDITADEYTLNEYPTSRIIIKFTKGMEDVVSELKYTLESKGFTVEYKEDKRFTDDFNPRQLSVLETNFTGTITKE